MRVGKEVSFMPEGKTIGQLMEEMRQKAGAQNYHGHDYMDLQRFAENTRHMIIFDVLTHDSPSTALPVIRFIEKSWYKRSFSTQS
jgi:hypothetical protein